jgi:hypothetical protein
MIGSTATGNDLSDVGPSPLGSETHLVTKHLNVANSIIANRFVTTSPSGWISSHRPHGRAGGLDQPGRGSAAHRHGSDGGAVVFYAGIACWLYVAIRFWLPIVLPLVCAGWSPTFAALTYRVRAAEQSERPASNPSSPKCSRPKSWRNCSNPRIVALGGTRREISVYFADVRGFTSLTDRTQVGRQSIRP